MRCIKAERPAITASGQGRLLSPVGHAQFGGVFRHVTQMPDQQWNERLTRAALARSSDAGQLGW